MANSQFLKALIKSFVDGNDAHFVDIAEQIASHEARLGHMRLADDLRAILNSPKSKQKRQKPALIAEPKGDLAGLLDATYPKTLLGNMVLDVEVHSKLARTIREHRQIGKILAHGLSPRRKLLLVGPPGTGKTMTASVLAAELSLPLYRVRLDSLISKYLGETAAKLRLVFDSMQENRGVYFFDEFDAIASQRGLTNDVGEIRRSLNSFLQMIEQDESTSLIIAATNHPEILDYAVFRRFDDLITYHLPDEVRITEMLRNTLSGYGLSDAILHKLAVAALNLSYADLVRATDDVIKESIISDNAQISQESLVQHFEERRAMRNFR
jgi:SpoVK/Ycf46/Vps4 family AAA+-type ATPase